MKIKSIECPKYIRNYEKKIFGTLDTWSRSHLFQRPSKSAYYIVDSWILGKVLLSNIYNVWLTLTSRSGPDICPLQFLIHELGGPSITTQTKRGGRVSVECPCLVTEVMYHTCKMSTNVHSRGRGSKVGKIRSTQLLTDPKSADVEKHALFSWSLLFLHLALHIQFFPPF